MKIHCPNCGYEGVASKGWFAMFFTFVARLHSQNVNRCPECGFNKAFALDDWESLNRDKTPKQLS